MNAAEPSVERSRRPRAPSILSWWLPLCGAALLLAGCAGRAAEWCDLACECEHCNEHEYDKCVIDVNEELDLADAYGCSDQADRLFECVLDSGHCVNDHWVSDDYCGGDWSDTARCVDINSSIIHD